MIEPRPPKKSEVLEVRLPYGTKQAFMQKAREAGRPASELIRDFIDLYLAAGDAPSTPRWESMMTIVKKHVATLVATFIGAATAVAIGLAVAPAGAVPDLKAAFGVLDADGDGVVTLEESASPGK